MRTRRPPVVGRGPNSLGGAASAAGLSPLESKILPKLAFAKRFADISDKQESDHCLTRTRKTMNLGHLSPDTLRAMLADFAKNWLAHDGLWFQAVERRYGLETAIALDAEAWEQFTAIEARRIMALHRLPENGGLEALKTALGFRLYAFINEQEILQEERAADGSLVSFEFQMVDCRVQSARRRKGLPLFPCKSVGLVEYEGFARTIDPRIRTQCLCCPPDAAAGADQYCAWRFSL